MAEPISVQCPKCKAKLKLKSHSAIGKKVACPKCKRPFVVQAPKERKAIAADDDNFLDDLNVSD